MPQGLHRPCAHHPSPTTQPPVWILQALGPEAKLLRGHQPWGNQPWTGHPFVPLAPNPHSLRLGQWDTPVYPTCLCVRCGRQRAPGKTCADAGGRAGSTQWPWPRTVDFIFSHQYDNKMTLFENLQKFYLYLYYLYLIYKQTEYTGWGKK